MEASGFIRLRAIESYFPLKKRPDSSEGDYKIIVSELSRPEHIDKINVLRELQNYSNNSYVGAAPIIVLLLPLLAVPPFVIPISIGCRFAENRTVSSKIGENSNSGVVLNSNNSYFFEPFIFSNLCFLLLNLNPYVSFAGNIATGVYAFNQESPINNAYIAKTFPCTVFDEALQNSALMSEQLWSDFKIEEYFNDQDQLSPLFYEDFEKKELKLGSEYAVYSDKIYAALDLYIRKQKELH